ncbi:hypothetical protein FF1_040486 [Malus domestica]
MPFSLKNAGATYQRLVSMMFKKKIIVTMEVYVDDIMVKGKQQSNHIVNLTGRTAALNRLFLWSTNRSKSFFKVIKMAHRDKSDDECKRAFQDLKKYLTSHPLVSKPELANDLYIYLAISEVAVSFALIREKMGPNCLYSTLLKLFLILVLVVVARELRPYFQAHTIFSSSYSYRYDLVSSMINPTWFGSFSKSNGMSVGTWPIQFSLLTSHNDKGPSLDGLHNRIHA